MAVRAPMLHACASLPLGAITLGNFRDAACEGVNSFPAGIFSARPESDAMSGLSPVRHLRS